MAWEEAVADVGLVGVGVVFEAAPTYGFTGGFEDDGHAASGVGGVGVVLAEEVGGGGDVGEGGIACKTEDVGVEVKFPEEVGISDVEGAEVEALCMEDGNGHQAGS